MKIIYWGPGESGKTTNFHRLQEIFKTHKISKGISITTSNDRTLWNDSVFFAFNINSLRLRLIINVSTTTGQERFQTTREYVLQNTDGIIFVGDSDPKKITENKRSFEEMLAFTNQREIPLLIQLNKRDLPCAISEHLFKTELGLPSNTKDILGFPLIYGTIAINRECPEGVKECFLDLLQKIILSKFERKK